ncbi:MAG: tetratricopeptide repeat protein, partial [Candidatus Binataceae bacterium]
MPTHRKLRRKELKQPDALVTFFEDAREFLGANFTQFVVSVAVVAAVAAIAFSFYFYERHRDRVTAAEFYDAFNALSAKHYKQAEDGFQRLAADQPSRELGRLARIYLADCFIVEKDLPRARAALVAYLATTHDPLFEGLALNELGVVYEQMGDFKRAQGAYLHAGQIPGPEAGRAQLAAARMLARTG